MDKNVNIENEIIKELGEKVIISGWRGSSEENKGRNYRRDCDNWWNENKNLKVKKQTNWENIWTVCTTEKEKEIA